MACSFQGVSLCYSLFCLLVSSVSGFCPDTKGTVDTFFSFSAHLFSHAVGREGRCKQITLACAHSALATLGLPRSRRVCPPCPHSSGSRLLHQEPSKAGPGLPAPPRSKPLRFRHLGSPQRRRFGWACVLCPSQVLAAQVMRCLMSMVAATYHLPCPCCLVF